MATQLPFSNIGQNIDENKTSLPKNINELFSVPDISLKRQSKPNKYNCNICQKTYNHKRT